MFFFFIFYFSCHVILSYSNPKCKSNFPHTVTRFICIIRQIALLYLLNVGFMAKEFNKTKNNFLFVGKAFHWLSWACSRSITIPATCSTGPVDLYAIQHNPCPPSPWTIVSLHVQSTHSKASHTLGCLPSVTSFLPTSLMFQQDIIIFQFYIIIWLWTSWTCTIVGSRKKST